MPHSSVCSAPIGLLNRCLAWPDHLTREALRQEAAEAENWPCFQAANNFIESDHSHKMVWVKESFKNHLVSMLLLWLNTSSTKLCYQFWSNLIMNPFRYGVFKDSLENFLASQHPHNKSFLLSSYLLSPFLLALFTIFLIRNIWTNFNTIYSLSNKTGQNIQTYFA